MPRIEKEAKDKIIVDYRDLSDVRNYKLLISLKQQYGQARKTTLPVVFLNGHFLNGEGQIRKGLFALVNRAAPASSCRGDNPAYIDLAADFLKFSPLMIAGAGLIDGINPCAFTVIVFFISFLALQGYRRRELAVIGTSFIGAVFLTYLLIGLGLFNFLYRLKSFWLVTKVVNLSIGILSLILGLLAIYDFFKFSRTANTQGLILQLPGLIKDRIRSIIGLHYRKSRDLSSGIPRKSIIRLIISALATGFLVSILEAICTGQVYLPVIIFVLKTTAMKLESLSYLLLYNLMFIIPLLAIFLLALAGATSGEFAALFKKYVLAVKALMAILFIGLGLFILWTV